MKLLLFAVVLAQVSGAVDPLALQRMAATERAFAAATAEIGVRDGFLAFFADDAIQIRPGPTGRTTKVAPARAALAEAVLSRLPLPSRLTWAPYTGHVSADGTLGWLTGSFVSRNLETTAVVSQGAYFSVWKRQSNGTWRVWLDEGAVMPELWADASPFRAAPEPDEGVPGRANDSIDAAERAVADGGEIWAAYLSASVRLHRSGQMPIVGRDAARSWAGATWSQVRYTSVRTTTAASNDLGVAVGGYDAILPAGPEHGTWVRVWKRDTGRRWRIVFETSSAAR